MESDKDIRWRQRFENFERMYKLLDEYAKGKLETELERAGVIQFYEVTIELAWKVMKDYLEAEGFIVKSPREAIKQSFQIGLIEDGHVWIEALTKRNLTTQTYDEAMTKAFVSEISNVYLPEFKKFYLRLAKEK